MLKYSLIIFMLLFTSSLIAQTADEILEKHFEVTGHTNLLEKNNVTMKGKLIQGGLEIPFQSYGKRPNKFRMDGTINEYTFTQAFDGETGWTVNPLMGINIPQLLPEEQADDLEF